MLVSTPGTVVITSHISHRSASEWDGTSKRTCTGVPPWAPLFRPKKSRGEEGRPRRGARTGCSPTMIEFQNLTWKEAGDAIARGVVAILPIGSTEAHGPHLPLATDVIISEEMSLRAAEKLKRQGVETLVLPAISYSVTDFSSDFPGTISIRKETAVALIRDICESLYQQGARLVVIANSHLEPEHVASINQAIDKVKEETGR